MRDLNKLRDENTALFEASKRYGPDVQRLLTRTHLHAVEECLWRLEMIQEWPRGGNLNAAIEALKSAVRFAGGEA